MKRTYAERALRIVDRILPSLPSVNGLHDPEGFMACSRRNYAREELYWRTMPRLRAKAEGGMPYIAMPKNMDHVFSGGVMYRISREFQAMTDYEASLATASESTAPMVSL